jgi:hypothetical protein
MDHDPRLARSEWSALALPSSTEKHLVERFALNADGQSLLYSFELTDPVYLAAPLRGELRWLYRPTLDVELVPCDPEATRSVSR